MDLITVDGLNINRLFEYKNKYEAALSESTGEEAKLELTEFIEQLNLQDSTFYCAATGQVIAFNIIDINGEQTCFHTAASDGTISAFTDACGKIHWDTKNLVFQNSDEIYAKVDGADFFVINNKIALV